MGRLRARVMENHLILGNQGVFCLSVRLLLTSMFSGSSEQRKQPVAMPEQGEFEKRLLLAKSKSKANNMPDIFQIP